jgi:hypothetical protein
VGFGDFGEATAFQAQNDHSGRRSRLYEPDPTQPVEEMRFVGHIGVRAGKLPMTLCIDRLDAFHLANQNVTLLGSPELAQGGGCGPQHRVCAALKAEDDAM